MPDDKKEPVKTDAVSAISSALAAFLIKKRLEEGATIEIPSLGITLKGPAKDKDQE